MLTTAESYRQPQCLPWVVSWPMQWSGSLFLFSTAQNKGDFCLALSLLLMSSCFSFFSPTKVVPTKTLFLPAWKQESNQLSSLCVPSNHSVHPERQGGKLGWNRKEGLVFSYYDMPASRARLGSALPHLKDVQVLVPGTYEYVRLRGKREVRLQMKLRLKIRWNEGPRISRISHKETWMINVGPHVIPSILKDRRGRQEKTGKGTATKERHAAGFEDGAVGKESGDHRGKQTDAP